MDMTMSHREDRPVEVIAWVQRRRRWTAEQKLLVIPPAQCDTETRIYRDAQIPMAHDIPSAQLHHSGRANPIRIRALQTMVPAFIPSYPSRICTRKALTGR